MCVAQRKQVGGRNLVRFQTINEGTIPDHCGVAADCLQEINAWDVASGAINSGVSVGSTSTRYLCFLCQSNRRGKGLRMAFLFGWSKRIPDIQWNLVAFDACSILSSAARKAAFPFLASSAPEDALILPYAGKYLGAKCLIQ